MATRVRELQAASSAFILPVVASVPEDDVMTTDRDAFLAATDGQLAAARLGVFPLNTEVCFQCVAAGVSPRKVRTSANTVHN